MTGSSPVPAASWVHQSVEVRASPIAGRGLFALAPLPAGTVVARPGGTPVASATCPGLARIDLTADACLRPEPGTPLHAVNHSCDPVLGWQGLALVALTDVAAGEELTRDYATSSADPGDVLRCHCPSARCRQMVEGTDWRIPQLQRRYAGRWVPHLQALIDVEATRRGALGPA